MNTCIDEARILLYIQKRKISSYKLFSINYVINKSCNSYANEFR